MGKRLAAKSGAVKPPQKSEGSPETLKSALQIPQMTDREGNTNLLKRQKLNINLDAANKKHDVIVKFTAAHA